MFDTIREWPRYVNVPFPIARVSVHLLSFYTIVQAGAGLGFSSSGSKDDKQ